MKTDTAPVFLTAEWRHLAMLNYETDASLLAPLVPPGAELDLWEGKSFVSVVGFLFQNTRLLGVPIPFHRNFEEVNLRFYVRRKAPDGWRRGVVFIKELVPRSGIAWIARTFYNEPYISLPMSHQIKTAPAGLEEIKTVRYSWRFNGGENYLSMTVRGRPEPLRAGSEAEFIAEHYWGYTAQRNGSTLEYQVEHSRWRVWKAERTEFHCDIAALYGERFSGVLSAQPASAFLAEGSAVILRKGIRLVQE